MGKKVIHGECFTRIYHIWQGMKGRCYNKNNIRYKFYGGKGIKVYKRWMNYKNFKLWCISNGYKDYLSIDRIDNNKNYHPNNCKFSTIIEQANNRSVSRYIEFNGIKLTVSQWSKKLNVPRGRINSRLNRGFKIEDIIINKEKRYAYKLEL